MACIGYGRNTHLSMLFCDAVWNTSVQIMHWIYKCHATLSPYNQIAMAVDCMHVTSPNPNVAPVKVLHR